MANTLCIGQCVQDLVYSLLVKLGFWAFRCGSSAKVVRIMWNDRLVLTEEGVLAFTVREIECKRQISVILTICWAAPLMMGTLEKGKLA